jgi:hypothetical protein
VETEVEAGQVEGGGVELRRVFEAEPPKHPLVLLVGRVGDRLPQVGVTPGHRRSPRPGTRPSSLGTLLAYCAVLRLRTGHLVYARGNEEPSRHIVRSAGVEIVCHALDLEAPADELLTAVDTLAEAAAGRALRVQPASGGIDDAEKHNSNAI